MSNGRKRPRAEEIEDRAECPFSVKVVDPKDKKLQKKKVKRSAADASEDDGTPKVSLQISPFAPSGKFKSSENMDIHYQVDPPKRWTDMTRYNSFVLNNQKYFSEGFIYVANDSSIERQKAVANKEPLQPRKKSEDDWVARILEIRASDEHHVYARVYWMYWPDELPIGTRDGKKNVQGRQPYHGANELIASNHMDIINVVSVTAPAVVNQWYEENDEEVQNALYWRQAFDVRTYELSNVESLCHCGLPGNPDRTLIGCTTEPCKKWLHEECIKHEALLATYKRLGTDKPQPPTEESNKGDKAGEEATLPMSPSETGPAASAQHSIDVKSNGNAESHDSPSKPDGNVDVKDGGDEDVPSALNDQMPRNASAQNDTGSSSPKSTSKDSKDTLSRKSSVKSKRKGGEIKGDVDKPYEGLFDVELKMDRSPPVLEFTDLREGIVGGAKTWQETLQCLVCGAPIN